MKVIKISSCVIAICGILSTSFPAYSNPYAGESGGVFTNSIRKSNLPKADNNKSESEKSIIEKNSDSVGNSEIQGLGNHDSWLSQEALEKNSKEFCDDVGLGSNTIASRNKNSSSTSEHVNSDNFRNKKVKGGGGAKVLFGLVNANGSAGHEEVSHQKHLKKTNSKKLNESDSRKSTVVKGTNCSSFVEAAAERDMNYQNNLTQRYGIKSGNRRSQVKGLID